MKYFIFITIFIALTACQSKNKKEPILSQPNILFIIADDLGFSDLGSYGGEISTPNLDKLAGEGTTFTQFYNNAVCVPTRSSLYTGYYPAEGLKRIGSENPNIYNIITLGESLKKAGYNTSLTGKWHLGDKEPNRPIDRGFDEFYGIMDGACNFFDPSIRDPKFYNGGHQRVFAHNDSLITSFPEKYYTTDAFTDHAIGMIEKFSKSETPFFVNVAYTAPHFPLHAKEDDIKKQLGKYDDLGNHANRYLELRKRRYQRQLDLGIIKPEWELSEREDKGGPWRWDYDIDVWLEDQDSVRELRRMEVYAAMVNSMDAGVGRLLKALKDNNVDNITVIVFISDNGGCSTIPTDEQMPGMKQYNQSLPGGEDSYEFLGPAWGWAVNTPFKRHKSWVHEGGISSPMIVKWPEQKVRGTINHNTVHIVDFAPTLVDISNGTIPEEWQGNIKTKTFKNEPFKHTPTKAYYWNIMGNKAIRKGKWKLVLGNGYEHWELYNLDVDRTEINDLAFENPEMVDELRKQWMIWDATYKENLSEINSLK